MKQALEGSVTCDTELYLLFTKKARVVESVIINSSLGCSDLQGDYEIGEFKVVRE